MSSKTLNILDLCGKPGCQIGPPWINFIYGLDIGLGGKKANRQMQLILVFSFLFFFLAIPVKAQDAAFDSDPHSATAGTLAGGQPVHHNQQPISSAAGAENGSNLKNWSRFSSSASRPMFVRVPAGTKMTGQNVSHYVRPQRVEPGKAVQAQAAQAQAKNGPVKRYLAYNLPAGHFAKKTQAAARPASSAASAATPGKKTAIAVRKPTHVPVLGYGKGGAVTTSYMPIQHKTAIACYHRYN